MKTPFSLKSPNMHDGELKNEAAAAHPKKDVHAQEIETVTSGSDNSGHHVGMEHAHTHEPYVHEHVRSLSSWAQTTISPFNATLDTPNITNYSLSPLTSGKDEHETLPRLSRHVISLGRLSNPPLSLRQRPPTHLLRHWRR